MRQSSNVMTKPEGKSLVQRYEDGVIKPLPDASDLQGVSAEAAVEKVARKDASAPPSALLGANKTAAEKQSTMGFSFLQAISEIFGPIMALFAVASQNKANMNISASGLDRDPASKSLPSLKN